MRYGYAVSPAQIPLSRILAAVAVTGLATPRLAVTGEYDNGLGSHRLCLDALDGPGQPAGCPQCLSLTLARSTALRHHWRANERSC